MKSNKLSRIGWYLDRMSVMEPSEIFYRIGKHFSMKKMEISFKFHQSSEIKRELPEVNYRTFRFCTSQIHVLPDLFGAFQPDLPGVQEYLQGKLNALGYDFQFNPDDPSFWHVSPDIRRSWPRGFFGSIRYRGETLQGDVRVIWEPSRLQHFIPLALLAKSGDPVHREKAVSVIETQFLSWVGQNPFLEGIHYISSMECGLRLIALCHAFDLVREDLKRPDEIWPAVVKLVEEHATLIEKRLSIYSSRGNHTISESAALVYAGILFPEFKRAGRWKEKGLSLLEAEVRRQIFPDGGGAEQSFSYLKSISDQLELVIRLLELNHLNVPLELELGFIRSRRFLKAVTGSSKKAPAVGDGDDGVALTHFPLYIKKEDFKIRPIETFPQSGYSLIGNQETPSATLLFDHGPLGMPPSFGHGHADALSVLFKLGEKEILIDPGTFTYNGNPKWRSFFKSTRAHNTVTVDETDQATQKASFLWSKPFRSRVLFSEYPSNGGFRILAHHNGYSRLAQEVEHYRGICFVPSGYWLIWDYLTGKGEHTLDLHWHLGVNFIQSGREFRCSDLEQPISLQIEGGDTTPLTGSTDPILGWKSSQYGQKEEIVTLRTRYQGPLPHEFTTRVQIGGVFQHPYFESTERFSLKGWTI